MKKLNKIFHFISYYVAWFVCLKLAAHHHPWYATSFVLLVTMLQLFWQIFIMHDTNHLFRLMIILTIVGSFTDTMLYHIGIIIFAANPFEPFFSPPWMMVLWPSFAVIYFVTLRSTFILYRLQSILGFFGFALAYFIGAQMQAATLPYGNLSSLLIGIVWALLLPLCMFIYQRGVN